MWYILLIFIILILLTLLLIEHSLKIKNKKELLEYLQKEEGKFKRELTQNIAHELKTPVTTIQGYLETLIHIPHIPEEKRRFFIERSYSQAIRLANLVNDISTLNKTEAKKIPADFKYISVSQIIEEVVSDTALQREEKAQSLTLKLNDEIEIQGDYSLIYSLFRNLSDNATAYSGEHSQITIECTKEDKAHYHFSFSDNGVGIPENKIERIFERFYRVDKGRSRTSGGTGLGLAIVKNAVLFHGGTISVKNRAEGGLEFLFTLSKKMNG